MVGNFVALGCFIAFSKFDVVVNWIFNHPGRLQNFRLKLGTICILYTQCSPMFTHVTHWLEFVAKSSSKTKIHRTTKVLTNRCFQCDFTYMLCTVYSMPCLPTTYNYTTHALLYFNPYLFRCYFFSIWNMFEQNKKKTSQKKSLCFGVIYREKFYWPHLLIQTQKHIYTRTLCFVQSRLENSVNTFPTKEFTIFVGRPRMRARCFHAYFCTSLEIVIFLHQIQYFISISC